MKRRAFFTAACAVAIMASVAGCPPSDFLGASQDAASLAPGPDEGGVAGDADVSAPDSSGPPRDCRPQEPGGLPALYEPPRPTGTGACDETTRTDLARCFGERKPSACLATLEAASDACRACIVSESLDPSWGPLIRYEDGTIVPNQAGCWEASAPDGGVGCGPKIQRRAECEYFGVCRSCTDPQPTELNACFKAATANDGACRKLQIAEQECTFPVATNPSGAPVFARCIQTSGAMPAAYWKGLFDFFCGP